MSSVFFVLYIVYFFIGISRCGEPIIIEKAAIENGDKSPKGAYPWMVHLPGCAGILIDSRHIITAAHCDYKSGRKFAARVGAYRQNDPNVIAASRVRNHPLYNKRNSHKNDIAIIRLDKPVQKAPNPYELGTKKDCQTPQRTKILGWGFVDRRETRTSDVLLEANNVQILRPNYRNCPHASQITAQDPARVQDSARGDSGGPLLVNKNGKLVCVGIVSYGINAKHPGCYTCVPYYIDWIKAQINDKNW